MSLRPLDSNPALWLYSLKSHELTHLGSKEEEVADFHSRNGKEWVMVNPAAEM